MSDGPEDEPPDPGDELREQWRQYGIWMDPFHKEHVPKAQFDFWFIQYILEPFLQWFQKWFGPDCFSWSKSFYKAMIPLQVLAIAMLGKHFLETGTRTGFGADFCTILYTLMAVLHLHLYRCIVDSGIDSMREKVMKHIAETGSKNPRIFCPIRYAILMHFVTMVIFYFAFGLIAVEDDVGFPTLFFFLRYLICYCAEACNACTPLRPAKPKWRSKMEDLQERIGKLTEGLGGSPAPSPA